MIDFNAAYNGTDRFGKDNRFGFFPAVGVGYVISAEPFFAERFKNVQLLKIRASYGIVGSDVTTGDRYLYRQVYNKGCLLYTSGSTDTQRNTFTAVSNFQYLYGQLAVDYERQFGIHGLKASVTGDTRQVLTDYNLPEIPSNVMANASYDYAKKYFAQAAVIGSYYNRYAPGKRWGAFYAFGLGWDISKEAFMAVSYTHLDVYKRQLKYNI